MNKTVIKKFAIEARKKLIASVTDKAGMLGITAKQCSSPISSGVDFAVYKTAAGTEVTLNKKQCEQRKKLVDQIEDRGFETIMEEVAYTWFNRICAIRFMEVNDYLPTRVRVLSSEKDGKTEPDIVTQAPDVDLDFTPEEKEHIIELKLKSDSKSQDELFKFLFIKQCNKLYEILPELFENTADYTELLLDISYTNKDEIIYMLVGDKDGIPESDFNITAVDENGEQTGQVEIIGWLYQYYISEKHDQIVNISKGTVKKEDIPAATQIFTTDWVVRYMVDNSLGRYWIERNPESKLAEKLQYFITPKDGHIEYVDEKVEPTELTFFDPCMGSGHILVYAFDVLMGIYRECGYSDRDAALNIVQHNLFGLDIDKRAHQLAYFAVMMKARSYNRRALTQGIFNNVAAIEESNTIEHFECEGITDDKEQNAIGNYLTRAFMHAREIGSLQTIEENDYKSFAEYLLNIGKKEVQLNMFSTEWIQDTYPLMLKLTKQAGILSRKYKVVCTNPPYMNKLEGNLKKFVVDNYKDYSGDLFSVFIYRNFDFCVKDGYSAFMTPFVWMFIKTYEKLRKYIIREKTISSLIQMEYSAFEEATVPICSFVIRNGASSEKSYYIKLSEFKGGMEIQKNKVLEAIADNDCRYFYQTEQCEFSKVPGSPIAYWIPNRMIQSFCEDASFGDDLECYVGMRTGDNARFLRFWFEVNSHDIAFTNGSKEVSYEVKWIPYLKGGDFRRWYNNYDYVVNWKNDGEEIKENTRKVYPQLGDNLGWKITSESEYFREGITFNAISSSHIGFKRFYAGAIFSNASHAIMSDNSSKLDVALAFLNTKVVTEILALLSPTINYTPSDIKKIPYKAINNKKIIELSQRNIEISKKDWDSFEISWNFEKHPLVVTRKEREEQLSSNIKNAERLNHVSLIEERFKVWIQECDLRFELLKMNEEELNKVFIDLYGLNNELSPEVEDKDVTIRKAELQREIKSLISYAIGCILGRYSIDTEGLIYAGGEWDASKYISFIPDADNIIPITDEEYFEDDIVGLFCKWLQKVYGSETLEENLDFIANALGNKGDSSREVIRNYFLKDFFADHCKTYQKRPIYWLFDSGKENGFKALIYLHRYDADTVGRVRTDYLHKEQSYVEAARRSAEYTVENSSSSSEKSKATKAVAKYTKQLAEMKIYDEAIAHIANQRIEIDLDDGVKVNYEKFQGIEVSREGQKAVKIDLLAKIK